MSAFQSKYAQKAFEKLKEKNSDMHLSFDEGGVYLHNFDGLDNPNDWTQEQIENALSDEFGYLIEKLESN